MSIEYTQIETIVPIYLEQLFAYNMFYIAIYV